MILVIDVGNTNIVFGVYEASKLIFNWRMETDRNKASDEFGMFIINVFNYEKLDINQIKQVIISSVVPPIMYSLEHAIRKYFELEPIIVNCEMKMNIKIKYENPKEVGADKIVNAVGAYEIYGGPIIIVDFGTATTFCAINSKGDYLGGVICAGIKISADALFQKTAKLPKIEISKPAKTIGTNTIESMQSGIVNGYVGQVEHIISQIKNEMNEENIKVVATGGLSRLIANATKSIDILNPMLTLEGLRIIYEKNQV